MFIEVLLFKKPPLPCKSPGYAPVNIWAVNKKEVSHIRCRTTKKFLHAREWMEKVGRKKDGPLLFLSNENLDRKKIKLL